MRECARHEWIISRCPRPPSAQAVLDSISVELFY